MRWNYRLNRVIYLLTITADLLFIVLAFVMSVVFTNPWRNIPRHASGRRHADILLTSEVNFRLDSWLNFFLFHNFFCYYFNPTPTNTNTKSLFGTKLYKTQLFIQ